MKIAARIILTILLLRANVRAESDCTKPQERQDGHCRAGCPQSISRFAQFSNLSCESGYYVGGGARCSKGECRCVDHGTWGWDYFGRVIPKKVNLNWWHGARCQGGTGAYKTDGPHVVCGH